MMTMQEFPVRYSLIEPNALANMLTEHYGLNSSVSCEMIYPAFIRFYSRGSNDLYAVSTENDSYFLRISQAGSVSSHVHGEVDLLRDLGAAGFHVPRPVCALDGGYVNEIRAPEGIRSVILFESLQGVEAYPQVDEKQSQALGAACARLHQWSDETEVSYRRPHLDAEYLLESSVGRLQHFESVQTSDFEFISTLAQVLRERMLDLPQGSQLFGLCHGDMIGGNARFLNGEARLLDFDTSGYGWYIYDLATFHTSIRQEPNVEDLWSAFLNGYSTVRGVDRNGVELLPCLVLVRHIWVMGHQAQIGEFWGHHWVIDRMRDNVEQLRALTSEMDKDLTSRNIVPPASA